MKTTFMSLILNLLLGLIGFVLLINPQTGVNFARYYIGIILIVASVIPFWSFYSNKIEKEWVRLLQGGVLIILGLVFILSFNFSAIVFATLLLIWMLSSAVMKIIIAFEYRRLFQENWWYMLIFGTISLLFALYMLLNLKQALLFLVSVAGIFMLVEASMGIIETVLSRNIRNNEEIE